MMAQPRIIILKEGTDTSQGRGQLISNINAVEAVTDILKTTLGPRGMDKLIHDGQKVTISNDGATIIKLLDIVHPAARTLTDIARSQDDEVGDGTTSVVLLAGEMLRNVKQLIEDGMHPQTIIKGFRDAQTFVLKKLSELAIDISNEPVDKRRLMLEKCAATTLNSKLISGYRNFFAKMAVDAVNYLDPTVTGGMDTHLIGIKRVPGGSVTDSFLVDGVAFKKTFAYAGFEQQPKSFANPHIVILNVELELKSESTNAEIRITDPAQYQSIVDAEWNIIYDKLDKISASGAKIVLSKLPIGDLATQYFADRDIFCAGRVPSQDLERVSLATGAVLQTSLNDLRSEILGTCGHFEERQIGGDRYNVFTGCPLSHTCTLILRGGSEQFIAETERSLHDAIMIVKRAVQHQQLVGGGGAIEMELSKELRQYSKSISSKLQLVVSAYAQAFEIIPRQLAENAGFDASDVLNQLRAKHAHGHKWFGVDIENEGVWDSWENFVWEPRLVKTNAIGAATEAACCILSVDETITATPPNDDNGQQAPAPMR